MTGSGACAGGKSFCDAGLDQRGRLGIDEVDVGFELGFQQLEPRIVDRASLPTDEDERLVFEVLFEPAKILSLGILLGQPIFDLVIVAGHRHARTAGEHRQKKDHQDNDRETVTSEKAVNHRAKSDRLTAVPPMRPCRLFPHRQENYPFAPSRRDRPNASTSRSISAD